MSTATTVFTLFLVTYGADVKHTEYDSLAQCQEARSFALYGKSVEKKKADDAEAEKARDAENARFIKNEEAREKFDKAHPTQDATWLQNQRFAVGTEVKENEADKDDIAEMDYGGKITHRSRSIPPVVSYSGSSWGTGSIISQNAVKTAECVVVPK